jgi:hypothetical protein
MKFILFFCFNFNLLGDYSIARIEGITTNAIGGTLLDYSIYYCVFVLSIYLFIYRGYIAPEVLQNEKFYY